MPVITVEWLEGRSPEQKRQLVAEITDSVHRIAGSPPDHINVVLHDVPLGNWGLAGKLVERRPEPSTTPAVSGGAGNGSVPVLDLSYAQLVGGRVRIVDLEQPRFQGMPVINVHQPGYAYFLHRRHGDDYRPDELGPRTSASGVIVCMEHSGTHIDAICHQADDQMLYGGIPAASVSTAKGFTKLAIEEVPPIIAPGVLLDVARARGVRALDAGYVVTAADLEACAANQGMTINRGDIVLVRTGNGLFWNDPERFLAGPGMDAGASHWIAEQGVLAVGADNMAWDVIGLRDPTLGMLPGHLILLARHGISIIENLDLEALADAGPDRFTFVCTPLKFVGATGSPVRPLALVPA